MILEIIKRHDLCGTYQIILRNKDGDDKVIEVDFTSKEDAIDYALVWLKRRKRDSCDTIRFDVSDP